MRIFDFFKNKWFKISFNLNKIPTGVIPDEPDSRDYIYEPSSSIPDHILKFLELRDGEIKPLPTGDLKLVADKFMPVVHQVGNSCTGYAGAAYVAAIGSNLFQSEQYLQANPQYLYYNARKHSNSSRLFSGQNPETQDNGATLRGLMKGMQKDGILLNAPSRPFDGVDGSHGVPTHQTDQEAAKWKMWTYLSIRINEDAPNLMRIRLELDKRPLIVGFRLYNFPALKSAFHKRIDIPEDWGKIKNKYWSQGGHAVAVLGYVGKYFYIQNSWGKGWHNGGFSYMHEDWFKSINLTQSIWTFET